MLFSIKRSAICAAALGAVLTAGVSIAREDDGGKWQAQSVVPPAAVTRPQLTATDPWEIDIEPAAGGDLVVAAAPESVETPRLTPTSSAGTRLGTFGSVAISAGKLPSAYKWRGVTGADYAALFTDSCTQSGVAGCDSMFVKRLRAARTAAVGQAAVEALRTVNAAVNAALRYASDKSIWGKGDYWATPSEIARKGVGDCEDFAITKMWMLRSLGFDADQLQLVVLQDTRRGIYHAVLAVHLDGARYILDNLSGTVSRDGAFPSYLPIMSFVGGKSYIHGFENKRSDTAGMPKDLAAVMPGEGV